VYFDREGYDENIFTGEDLNAKHNWGLRGDLRFEASDSLTLTLLADYRKVDQDGRAMDIGGYATADSAWQGLGFGIAGPGVFYQGSPLAATIDYFFGLGGFYTGVAAVDTDPWDRKLSVNFAGEEELDAYGLALIVDVEFKNMALKSITSYRTHDFYQAYDLDGSEFELTRQGGPESVDAFMQELRLNSIAGEKFDWIAGLFYYHQESVNEFNITINNIFADPDLLLFGYFMDILMGGALTGAEFGTTHTRGEITLDSYAAFVRGTYHINDKLDITLGGRYTYEEKDSDYFQSSPSGNIAFGLEEISRQINSGSWSAFTPAVIVDYSFTPEIHAYATYATGFKSGGFSDIVGSIPDESFEQETTTNYEIGLKAKLFDERMHLGVSVFQFDWDDKQGTLRLPPKSITATVDIMKEATLGDVQTRGFELEIMALPVRDLTLSGGLGIIKSEWTSVSQDAYDEGMREGDSLEYVPEWSLNLGVKYDFSIGDFCRAFAGVNGVYRDDIYIEGNDPNVEAVQKGYALINAQLGFALLSIADLDITFWVKNITDEEYITFQTSTSLDNLVSQVMYNRIGAPRTFGIDIRYNF